MLSYNRVIRFVTVSFILLFSGRISKAELFHSYFRQIQEIEIRNSQDLQKSKALIGSEQFSQVDQVSLDNSLFAVATVLLSENILRQTIINLPVPKFNLSPKRFEFFFCSPSMAP